MMAFYKLVFFTIFFLTILSATPIVQTISYKKYNSSNKQISEQTFYVISPRTENDIVPLNTLKVTPVLYTNSVPLSSLSIAKKKETFINLLLPSILLAKYKVELEKKKLLQLVKKIDLNEEDIKWLTEERKLYGVESFVELYFAMRTHPNSIIIAQAIVESGWGTSKFFQEANNIFGIWSFDEKDNRMAANEKRGKKVVYLKKYKSFAESVDDYLLNISRNIHYKEFRKKRLTTQDPFILVKHLERYSERGEAYIEDLKTIIRTNKLEEYDNHTLEL